MEGLYLGGGVFALGFIHRLRELITRVHQGVIVTFLWFPLLFGPVGDGGVPPILFVRGGAPSNPPACFLISNNSQFSLVRGTAGGKGLLFLPPVPVEGPLSYL